MVASVLPLSAIDVSLEAVGVGRQNHPPVESTPALPCVHADLYWRQVRSERDARS
jgi:hypothetical protein